MNLSRDDGHAHPDLVHPSPSSTIPSSPPVTDEDFLVKEGSVGTEEGDGVEAEVGVLQADVVGLAVLLRVGVVTPHYQPGAREGGVLGGELFTERRQRAGNE